MIPKEHFIQRGEKYKEHFHHVMEEEILFAKLHEWNVPIEYYGIERKDGLEICKDVNVHKVIEQKVDDSTGRKHSKIVEIILWIGVLTSGILGYLFGFQLEYDRKIALLFLLVVVILSKILKKIYSEK